MKRILQLLTVSAVAAAAFVGVSFLKTPSAQAAYIYDANQCSLLCNNNYCYYYPYNCNYYNSAYYSAYYGNYYSVYPNYYPVNYIYKSGFGRGNYNHFDRGHSDHGHRR